MDNSIFANDYKNECYWWEDAPRPNRRAETLPTKVDVLVIGSGYTGLMAARETAIGGRSTLVVDAEAAGFGCSSRNGGQVSTSIKPSFESLSGRFNQQVSFDIRREGIDALDYITDLIEHEKLDCDWRVSGRFHAAHNTKQYDKLAKHLERQPKGIAVPYQMIPKAEQAGEIGSSYYHGGAVYPKHGALHPGKYHLELLRLAEAAGVQVVGNCPVIAIDRGDTGFRVTTSNGIISARDVVVATNGYTGTFAPWLRRRVIPIGSYIIATEQLSVSVAKRLLPNNRVISDTRNLVFYYRLSPDGRRMLFGGRVAINETNPSVSAPRLHHWMTQIFPDLQSAKVAYSWMGRVAFTFDTLPHIGQQNGIWFAMGYCGSGVSLSTYFGMKIGKQLLGKAEGKSPLDNLSFSTRPLYSGNPWFLAPSILYYRIRDSLPL